MSDRSPQREENNCNDDGHDPRENKRARPTENRREQNKRKNDIQDNNKERKKDNDHHMERVNDDLKRKERGENDLLFKPMKDPSNEGVEKAEKRIMVEEKELAFTKWTMDEIKPVQDQTPSKEVEEKQTLSGSYKKLTRDDYGNKNMEIQVDEKLPEKFRDEAEEWQRQHDSMNEFEKEQYQRVLDIVKKREGKIISPKYIGYDTKMEIQCADGHKWGVTPGKLLDGRWCPHCKTTVGESITREFFQRMFGAEFPNTRPDWLRQNGRKLELDGLNEELKIAFEYQGPHHYEIGHYHSSEKRLKETQQADKLKHAICEERGIHLLIIPHEDIVPYEKLQNFIIHEYKKISGLDVPNSNPLDYHDFAIYKKNYAKLKQFVEEKQGKLISEVYPGYKKPVYVKCDKGDIWKTTPDNLYRDSWCPFCQKVVPDSVYKECPSGDKMELAERFFEFSHRCNRKKLDIEAIREFVEKKGGKLISDIYVNSKEKIQIECDRHHLWETNTDHLLRGSWCPHFNGMSMSPNYNGEDHKENFKPDTRHLKHNIEEIREIVVKKGGKLLSDKYLGYKEKIQIECDEHHFWETTPDHLFHGSWCPHFKNMPLVSGFEKENKK